MQTQNYLLSQTEWYAQHQRECAAIAHFFSPAPTHHIELDQMLEEFETRYENDLIDDGSMRLVYREYDALLTVALCGSAADIDEEGPIYDRQGEEIIDD